jgi:hypothetical protein
MISVSSLVLRRCNVFHLALRYDTVRKFRHFQHHDNIRGLCLRVLRVGTSHTFSTTSGKEEQAEYFFQALTKNGNDLIEMKRCYLKLARDNHPDANPNDTKAAAKFVLLGKTYEKILKNIAMKKTPNGSDDIQASEDEEQEDEYGEEEVRWSHCVLHVFSLIFVLLGSCQGAEHLFRGRRTIAHEGDAT